MSVDQKTVRHVAKLARIAMSDDEVDALVPELNQILGWVEHLSEVDTDGVEPMTSAVAATLPLREDVVTDGGDVSRVLGNAPRAVDGFYVVPKVVE